MPRVRAQDRVPAFGGDGEQGLAVHEERLARAYQAGTVGFLERWAQQKDLDRRKKTRVGWRNFWSRFQRSTR